MKFLCIYKSAKKEGVPPTEKEMETMGKLVEEGLKAGWLLSTEGCMPSSLGARVRLDKGKYTVVDGPFTESKELVGGFAIIQGNSLAEVVERTRHFLSVAGDGETEIRQLYDAGDCTAGAHSDLKERLTA